MRKPYRFSKRALAVTSILIVLLIIGYVLMISPVVGLVQSSQASLREARKLVQTVRTQDLDSAKQSIESTRTSLRDTERKLHEQKHWGYIPVVGWYYNDAVHIVRAGFHGLEVATITTEALTPYADILGLKGQGSFLGGTAQERLTKAVQTMDKITPKLDDIGAKLSLVRKEIDQVDPRRYPEGFGKYRLRSRVEQIRTWVDQGESIVVDAKPVLKVLPSVMGEPKMKTYLVLFQNDKELRPTGGFLSAYAIIRMERGKILAGGSDDIYRLDERRAGYVPPPRPIIRFLPQGDGSPATEWNIRDTNLSPDYRESMETFERFYANVAGREQIDGIIGIDTKFVEELMRITGPVYAAGIQFSADNDPRCNCPNVVYELENYTQRTARLLISRGQNIDRKAILGDLMHGLLTKALGSGHDKFTPLFETALRMGREKHVLLYLKDAKAQEAAERFNWAGRIREFDGDFLHINDGNFAGFKANLYIEQTVEQKIDIERDGTITKTVTIEYRNPQSGDGWLNGRLRDWIRLYVPKGSKLVSSSGSQVAVETSEDLGKTVFEGFFTLNPKNVVKLSFTYTLPFKAKGRTLTLLMQKQPGTSDFEHTLIVNGKAQRTVRLSEDKEVTLKI